MAIGMYFASYTISLLGNSVINVVLPVLVLAATGEPLMAGLVALASGASTVVFGMLSGPLIDRGDKRIVAGIADMISAGSVGLLAAVATFGELSPLWFVLSAFLSGIGDMPAWNAREAMIYGLQRESGVSLERLVGIRETVSAAAIVIGPTLAGILMHYFDPRPILWITCVTSLIAGLTVLMSPKALAGRAESVGEDEKFSLGELTSEGFSYLMQSGNKTLRTLTGFNIASVALVSVLQSLLIPVVMVLNNAAGANGYALGAIGLGLLLGGGLYAVMGMKLRAWSLLVASTLSNVLVFGLLSLFISIPYVICLCFLFGLTSATVGAVTGVLSLQVTEEEFRGRVNGFQNSMSMVVGPISVFALSWLVSVSNVSVATGALVVLWTLANVLMLISLRGDAFVAAKPASTTADGSAAGDEQKP